MKKPRKLFRLARKRAKRYECQTFEKSTIKPIQTTCCHCHFRVSRIVGGRPAIQGLVRLCRAMDWPCPCTDCSSGRVVWLARRPRLLAKLVYEHAPCAGGILCCHGDRNSTRPILGSEQAIQRSGDSFF